MTIQPLSVSVICAPLAAIDRRSLSQAWYSALHLSQRAAACAQPERKRVESGRQPSRGVLLAGDARSRPEAREPLPARRLEHADRPARGRFYVERRAARSPLGRRIERALLAPRAELKRLSLTIDKGGARVHLVFQTTRAGVKVIALCPPGARRTVARALYEACFALAARGIEVETCS